MAPATALRAEVKYGRRANYLVSDIIPLTIFNESMESEPSQNLLQEIIEEVEEVIEDVIQ